MGDYASGLPVRTEADGTDERLHAKIVDGVDPSKRATVDSDLNLHIEVHGNDPTAADKVLRLSQLGAVTPDGVYHATDNTKPGNVGLIASFRSATPGDTTQTMRVTAKQGTVDTTVWALDVSLHDEDGNKFSGTNPMPVTVVESEGSEVNDPNSTNNTAAAATSNHDYTVTAGKTLILTQISAVASGKLKAEVMIETGVATGTFVSYFWLFNSTANPNTEKVLREPIMVAAGVRVRVARTNTDNQAQNLYSTISGHEI